MHEENIGSSTFSVVISLICIAIYVLTPGFVMAPIENHAGRWLEAAELFYSPLWPLYNACPAYEALIDWEDSISTGW